MAKLRKNRTNGTGPKPQPTGEVYPRPASPAIPAPQPKNQIGFLTGSHTIASKPTNNEGGDEVKSVRLTAIVIPAEDTDRPQLGGSAPSVENELTAGHIPTNPRFPSVGTADTALEAVASASNPAHGPSLAPQSNPVVRQPVLPEDDTPTEDSQTEQVLFSPASEQERSAFILAFAKAIAATLSEPEANIVIILESGTLPELYKKLLSEKLQSVADEFNQSHNSINCKKGMELLQELSNRSTVSFPKPNNATQAIEVAESIEELVKIEKGDGPTPHPSAQEIIAINCEQVIARTKELEDAKKQRHIPTLHLDPPTPNVAGASEVQQTIAPAPTPSPETPPSSDTYVLPNEKSRKGMFIGTLISFGLLCLTVLLIFFTGGDNKTPEKHFSASTHQQPEQQAAVTPEVTSQPSDNKVAPPDSAPASTSSPTSQVVVATTVPASAPVDSSTTQPILVAIADANNITSAEEPVKQPKPRHNKKKVVKNHNNLVANNNVVNNFTIDPEPSVIPVLETTEDMSHLGKAMGASCIARDLLAQYQQFELIGDFGTTMLNSHNLSSYDGMTGGLHMTAAHQSSSGI